MALSSRAIVLSTTDFGEADRYVELFTKKWGVISALAKSARKSKKRYVGGLDLFCHNEVVLRGDPKERPYLQELSVLNSFQELRADLEKMLIAGRVLQWVKKLANQAIPMENTFSLLGQTIALIEAEPDNERLEALLFVFKMKILTQQGSKPRVDSCVHCASATNANVYLFDIASGGVVCQSCFSGERQEDNLVMNKQERDLVKAGIGLKLKDWKDFEFPKRSIRGLSSLMTFFGSYHFHTKLPI